MVSLLKDAMGAKATSTKGFVIDGFPANLEQAKLFEEKIGAPTKIMVFDVNEEVLRCRLTERQNFDDKPESIVKRIETFNQKTKPVIKQYAKSAINVSDFNIHKIIFLHRDTFRSMLTEALMSSLLMFAKL